MISGKFGALLLLASLGTACTDRPTEPIYISQSAPGAHLDQGTSGCPEYVIICDETGGDPTVTFGEYTEDVGDVDGSGEATLALSASESAQYAGAASGSAAICPPAFNAVPSIHVTLFPPGEAPLTITVAGWFYILLDPMLPGMGRYSVPRNNSDAEGMWQEYPWQPGMRRASVANADGHCYIVPKPGGGGFDIRVSLFKYNGVRIRYPSRSTSYGGGSEGGAPNCHQEYVYLEINYGDGTGWHVIWQGYATVCG